MYHATWILLRLFRFHCEEYEAGIGRVWNRDGRSSTYGCDLDPDNAEHVDQEPEVPGAHFVAGEFSGHSWLCGYYVHNVPRFAADPREAVYRGLARAASVLWHCDIFFRGYYFGVTSEERNEETEQFQ